MFSVTDVTLGKNILSYKFSAKREKLDWKQHINKDQLQTIRVHTRWGQLHMINRKKYDCGNMYTLLLLSIK